MEKLARSLSRRRFLQATGVAALVVACQPVTPGQSPAPSAAPTSAAKKGGVLRASTLGGLPKVLHPYPESQNFTTPWSDANNVMWAGLISIDYDKLDWIANPQKDLAKELPKVSADGKTFTFTLRDDIKWSDGKPITSADFLFAWQQATKKENNYIGYDDLITRVDSYKTPDAKTVEVTLKEKLARFVALSQVSDITPVPKHIWEGKPWLDATANPEVIKPSVVPGPFMIKEITAERASYTRNPQWWGKSPNLDEITFIGSNPNTVLELLNTKQVEWAQSFPPAQYATAKAIPHATVYEWSGATGSYRVMQFNLARPNIKEKKFREALSRSLRREDMLQFEENLAVPQYGFYTQGNRWRFDGAERYEFDLNKSKQLLTDAGYKLSGTTLMAPDGKAVKMDVLWPTTSQPRGKIAAYAQQQWKQLGIETNVIGMEFNAFVDRYSRQKDFDIAMGSFSAGLDPDGPKEQLKTGGAQNAMGYSNKRVDELLAQGVVEQDDTKRKSIYDEIQKIVMDELPIYYMITLKVFTAFDKKVKDIVPLKGGDIFRQNNRQFMDWWLDQ
ncbi:MAG TPA: ABC transporter substrate-binding protein [Candidatus Limnocylindria bacterium]|nr:ABC transporter substrate-binding protein [Candidatus Limnocylindria bacterium]